jgi:hypothetical protein
MPHFRAIAHRTFLMILSKYYDSCLLTSMNWDWKNALLNIKKTPAIIKSQAKRGPSEKISGHPEYVSRAFRYPIHTPIRFRKSDDVEWHEGMTLNISRTGIFFQSDMNLPPRTLLEMQISLPHGFSGEPQANVLCWGPVVRLDPKPSEQGETSMAAVISRYRFGHE